MRVLLCLFVLWFLATGGLAQKNKGQHQTSTSKRSNQSQTDQRRDITKQAGKPDTESYKIAREGVGIEGIIVGKSTKQDVIKKFGKDYKWIVHRKYSYQMAYPNGLSFYICQSDKKQQIFDIEINLPYKAKTSRGVILNKSTVEDVYKIYGKPSGSASSESLEYKGVNFSYTKRGKDKVITTIDIVERQGLRQCEVRK